MKLFAIEGLLKGLKLDLEEKDEWFIGRDPDQCSFVLEDSSVSRKHAKIQKTDDGYTITNLSETNHVEINDEDVDSHPLKEGDKIKIGNTIFLYTSLSDEEAGKEEEPKEEEIPSMEEGTIFEEPIEEIPSALFEESPFVLKVISGPNAGAEFGMEKLKSYIIGKDPNLSEIIFTDLSVSKKNSKISIEDDGNIYIEDLGSKNGTYLNNIQITKKTKLNTEDLITVGTTTFLIVAKDQAAETIYSPAPSFDVEEEEEEKKEKVSIWKKQFIPTKHLVLAGALTLIVFVVFLSFFALFKSNDIEVTKKEPEKDIEKILCKYADIEFSYNPSAGNVFLVGHILSAVAKQEMLYDLNQLSFLQGIQDNIVVDEGIVKDFNETLETMSNFQSVTTHAPCPGQFVLEGSVKDSAAYESLVDYANFNFPYVDKLENKVVIEQILQAAIAAKLQQKNLSGITFELISTEIVLAGRYDKKNKSAYDDLIDELKKTNGIQTVKNLAIPSNESAARIDVSSQYKITGEASANGKNISVIANGQIVGIGDALSGMIVTKITKNTILLEKDELKYKIDYSR